MPLTRRHLAAIAVMAVALLPAPAAGAGLVGKPLEKAMWGPARVDGVSQFPIYEDLGVTIWQTQLRWEDIARTRPADPANPADPAYRWPAEIDYALGEAARHRIKVLLLVQGTPSWASGHGRWQTPPRDPGDFAAFVAAAARRYPAVRHWMIWGEPTRNLRIPETSYDFPERVELARIYADMLDRSYVALKSASRQNLVIGGNTFTSNRISVPAAPVPVYEWMRILRLPSGRPPRMDMWGHNPFTGRRPSRRPARSDARGDMSDIGRFVRRLRTSVSRPLRRPVPVFISEFCVPSGPNPYFADLRLTRREQADWLRRAFSIVRAERYLHSMGWWTLRDSSEAVGENSANRCGLLDARGRPKLAYRTFKRARRSPR